MGNNIFESNPTIKGKNKKLSLKQKQYFNRVNTILRNNYLSNLYSDYNLQVSLEQKSFENSQLKPNKLEEISWIDFIYRHLESVIKQYVNANWVIELKNALSKEPFVSENKYFSDFFYNEYNFKTCPLIINELYNDLNDNIIDGNNHPLIDLNNSLYNNKDYNELDVTDNLGGSYLETNIEYTDQNDPTFQYNMRRKNLKKYVKIFKKHIYNNLQHPINRVIFLFVRSFCRYINTNINNYKNQLSLPLDNFEKNIKNFENEITICLGNFIITMHTSLKLFYSTSINYTCFDEEKDDIINLITSLFFKTGILYDSIYNLYLMSYSHDIEKLQEKFIDLKNVKPKELGVQIKFCLDEDTLELQRNILKEKQNEINLKENEQQKK